MSAARPGGRLAVEYGDYECPYSRQAFREIQRLERKLGSGMRFAFRHFPLTSVLTPARGGHRGR